MQAHGQLDGNAGIQVLDSGTLQAPLPVSLHGSALQDCLDNWERQHSIHAVAQTGGLILLQLMRYRTVAGHSCKDSRSLPSQPGQVIGLPQFDSERAPDSHGELYCSLSHLPPGARVELRSLYHSPGCSWQPARQNSWLEVVAL